MLRLCWLTLLLLAALRLVHAEVIHYQTCPDTEADCTMGEVRVDPCPQAVHNAACRIRRRRPGSISFKFTPHFDAERLETTLVWVKSETEELPMVSLERDACKNIQCPIKSGELQTYALTAPVEAKFPISSYTIRWRLKDPVSGKMCCFNHDIKVVN
ncbi:MD-2-related lipid-recognition protein-like [Drosophila busckii]|uniref:MD-2-related lipid-recognition protein-like n=1 Tax=Drosophila busckii TaxID=30019 RepID=UPI00083EC1FE|nr:MD-2-related lipid-recognition protein-like [Drosophila busckii]